MSSPNVTNTDLEVLAKSAKQYEKFLANRDILYFYNNQQNQISTKEIEYHPAKFLHLAGISLASLSNSKFPNGKYINYKTAYEELVRYDKPKSYVKPYYFEFSHGATKQGRLAFRDKNKNIEAFFSKLISPKYIVTLQNELYDSFIHVGYSDNNLGVVKDNINKVQKIVPRSNYLDDLEHIEEDFNGDRNNVLLTLEKVKNSDNKYTLLSYNKNISQQEFNAIKNYAKKHHIHLTAPKYLHNELKNTINNNYLLFLQKNAIQEINMFIQNLENKGLYDQANFCKTFYHDNPNTNLSTIMEELEFYIQEREIKLLEETENLPLIDYYKFPKRIGFIDGVTICADKNISFSIIENNIKDLLSQFNNSGIKIWDTTLDSEITVDKPDYIFVCTNNDNPSIMTTYNSKILSQHTFDITDKQNTKPSNRNLKQQISQTLKPTKSSTKSAPSKDAR